MNSRKAWVLVMLIGLWPTDMPGFAQGFAAPRVLIRRPPFTEERPRLVDYAARDLMGVAAGPLRGRAVSPEILLSGLRSTDQILCVSIERSNGGYRASFTTPNPGVGDTVQLVLPSRLIAGLRAQPGEMAVRAQVSRGSYCRDSDPFVAVSWAGQTRLPVSLLVNSQRASYVAVSVGGRAAVECRPLRDALAVPGLGASSFDTACPTTLTGQCGAEQQVVVQRRDGPRYRSPYRFTVRSACRTG